MNDNTYCCKTSLFLKLIKVLYLLKGVICNPCKIRDNSIKISTVSML